MKRLTMHGFFRRKRQPPLPQQQTEQAQSPGKTPGGPEQNRPTLVACADCPSECKDGGVCEALSEALKRLAQFEDAIDGTARIDDLDSFLILRDLVGLYENIYEELDDARAKLDAALSALRTATGCESCRYHRCDPRPGDAPELKCSKPYSCVNKSAWRWSKEPEEDADIEY